MIKNKCIIYFIVEITFWQVSDSSPIFSSEQEFIFMMCSLDNGFLSKDLFIRLGAFYLVERIEFYNKKIRHQLSVTVRLVQSDRRRHVTCCRYLDGWDPQDGRVNKCSHISFILNISTSPQWNLLNTDCLCYIAFLLVLCNLIENASGCIFSLHIHGILY